MPTPLSAAPRWCFCARNAGPRLREEAIQKGSGFSAMPIARWRIWLYECRRTQRTAVSDWHRYPPENSAALKAAVRFLTQTSPSEDNYHHYYLYYASQAYFQAAPEAWKDWNRVNTKSLALTQNANGSWDGQHGPTFSTAASLLSLALNYRFLPIYER